MKMQIKEFAKLTGVSVRTLHYYDEIGLLKPALVDAQNGYRFYDENSLLRMQEILFYRELDFPLNSILEILSSPDYDKQKALVEQRNILTCAAPNLRERASNPMNPHAGYKQVKVTPDELETLLTSRIRRIFEVAVANENEVLILGAFGCGAFRNPPEIVAKVFYNVMQDYLCYFDTIEYAVYHTEREVGNYEAFKRIMNV